MDNRPPKFRFPEHEVNFFVDDSFNNIAFEPSAKIKTYLERYNELMHSYCDVNLS